MESNLFKLNQGEPNNDIRATKAVQSRRSWFFYRVVVVGTAFDESVFGKFAKNNLIYITQRGIDCSVNGSTKMMTAQVVLLLDDARYILCDLFRCKMNINAI